MNTINAHIENLFIFFEYDCAIIEIYCHLDSISFGELKALN